MLVKQFEKMGARVKTRSPLPEWRTNRITPGICRLDVKKDGKGTFFEVTASPDVEVEILDCKPKDRHLLLMARIPGRRHEEKPKFLCGHDERDWFVAAVPERGGISSVAAAMEALKPDLVQDAQTKKKLKTKDRKKRHTKAYMRQGEWFFLPAPDLQPDPKLILRNEPLQRGGGKPHMAEELYRIGGTTVYVSAKHPNGLTQAQYNRLTTQERKLEFFRTMHRDPQAFVRGKIRHSDHKTLVLIGWHRVVPNTETGSSAFRHVAFLD